MNFHNFVSYNDYPLLHRAMLRMAIKSFFMSARLRPYTDAISRNADTTTRQQCSLKIKDFTNRFVTFLESEQGKSCIQQISELNIPSLDRLVDSEQPQQALIKSFLRKILFWRFSQEIDAIQHFIINTAKKYLTIEHDVAMESLDEDRLCSFDEYCIASWENASRSKDTMTITIQQWYGYLLYVESIVAPYLKDSFDTENKFQAHLLYNKINAVCHKIESSTNELQTLITQQQVIEQQINEVLNEKLRMKLIFREESNSPPDEPVNYPDELQLKLAKLTDTHLKLCRQRTENKKSIGVLSSLFSQQGSLDRSSAIVKDFDGNLHYWQSNLPLISRRADDIKAIADFTTAEKGHDILYRYVSTGEYQSLVKTQKFDQSRAHSNEREKWFFYKGGNPGNGVSHEVICEIYLRKGALKHLLSLQQPDGQFATVAFKVYEQCCLGIHEDALAAFNQLIATVKCRDKVTKKLLKVIQFPTSDVNMLNTSIGELTRSPLILFASIKEKNQAGNRDGHQAIAASSSTT